MYTREQAADAADAAATLDTHELRSTLPIAVIRWLDDLKRGFDEAPVWDDTGRAIARDAAGNVLKTLRKLSPQAAQSWCDVNGHPDFWVA